MNSLKANQDFEKGSSNKPHWSVIYDSLSRQDQVKPLEAEELYTLSLAAYLTGKDNESVDFLSRAHHQYLKKNNIKQGIRCSFWIGMQLMFKGERARGSGWFARAFRIIEEFQYEGPEQGLLSIPAALGSLSKGNPEKAFAIFKQASDKGEKYNDADLKTLSLLGQGQALIQQGNLSKGISLLDESMVAVESDEISPIVVGIVYCAVIETCQLIFDIRRAQEWTGVLSRWCESQPGLVPFRGQCLIRRSQIRHIHGEWSEALDEMKRACHFLSQPPGEPAAGEAYYQVGDIYRLRGEADQAEKSYLEANKWGRKPQPGMALLRLKQNNIESAMNSIQNALDEARKEIDRIRILPAYIKIMLAADDLKKARSAVEVFSSLVEKYDTPFIQATSACALGSVLLAEEENLSAIKTLRKSLNLWNELDAPYEIACVRQLLGLAYKKEGDEDSALLELKVAHWLFKELQALPDLQKIEPLLKKKNESDHHELTLREIQVLRLVAEGKTNKSVAGILFISERTVERHLSNIFNKLNVNSRTEAATHALKHSLLI